jgi:heme-degrading monooxygenase HmoA
MIEIIYEYRIKEGAGGHFELAYGPGGAWSKLFAPCPGFRGITLLRDTEDLRRYLAIELWDTAAEREEALAEQKDEYARLDAALDGWTTSRTEVGTFGVRAEATVRPHRMLRQGKASGSRRGSR